MQDYPIFQPKVLLVFYNEIEVFSYRFIRWVSFGVDWWVFTIEHNFTVRPFCLSFVIFFSLTMFLQ